MAEPLWGRDSQELDPWRGDWGEPDCQGEVLLLAWLVLLPPDLAGRWLSPKGPLRCLLSPSGQAAGSLLCRLLPNCPLWGRAWEQWTKVTLWMDQNTRKKRWPSR